MERYIFHTGRYTIAISVSKNDGIDAAGEEDNSSFLGCFGNWLEQHPVPSKLTEIAEADRREINLQKCTKDKTQAVRLNRKNIILWDR